MRSGTNWDTRAGGGLHMQIDHEGIGDVGQPDGAAVVGAVRGPGSLRGHGCDGWVPASGLGRPIHGNRGPPRPKEGEYLTGQDARIGSARAEECAAGCRTQPAGRRRSPRNCRSSRRVERPRALVASAERLPRALDQALADWRESSWVVGLMASATRHWMKPWRVTRQEACPRSAAARAWRPVPSPRGRL